jgi:CRISPR-associated endonuclease/helicase Cas3
MIALEPNGYFRRLFARLSASGKPPFYWQEALFEELLAGRCPNDVCVPTGLGKTSLMQVWLLALVWESQHRREVQTTLPTRLVWVVDRRVVVDQATAEAEILAKRIEDPENDDVRKALEGLSVAGDQDKALAVSTLRGELADNRAWSRDPSRPAIIVGTVDMIGSRLLFSGYGDSRRRRALHAGLLGHDTLIVNDEAHLTPAFAELLARLGEFTRGERSLRTMRLSATPRDNTRLAFPANLDADLANDVFRNRYRAVKRLRIHKHDSPTEEVRKLASEPYHRTIVFVRSPEEARKIAVAIERKNKVAYVPLLTGLQRGWERDRLLKNPVVERFLAKEPQPGGADPCWLVATSAGEVGIDLSADRLITDLDTADHLLQRFGRLNRFGETEGEAHVVYSDKQITGEKEAAPRLRETLKYLEKLPNVSPETLRKQQPPTAALSAMPNLAPLLPWHVDVWSMTSISATDWPSRPSVDYWLRGDDESVPPETYVAWREDVADLADPGVSPRDREEVFDCYRVIAQERLKQYTEKLCNDLEESNCLGKPAILIGADGEVHAGTLAELLNNRRLFRYGTLLLPPGVGYLDLNGMVDWTKSTAELSQGLLSRYDVSATETRTRARLAFGQAPPKTDLRWRYTVKLPTDDENEEGPRWMYFVGKLAQKAPKTAPLLLSAHQEHVAGIAARLARRFGFDERTVLVFEWAARWHDAGKGRARWQRAACNAVGSEPVAKCERLNIGCLDGYRHELGSLLDAESQVPSDFTAAERELALHLIAAHHGWARPHFPARTFDKDFYRHSERAALDCARRFGRLQQRYGAWGLAYVESIFRSADTIASAGAPELPVNA